MKDVLKYTNYHQYIADYYAEKKAKSAFTWQTFTRAAGFSSPVFLKYVSEGRSNLGEETARQVANAMGLVGYEQDYFVEMVKFGHAKTDEEKKSIFNRMLAKIRCSVNLPRQCLEQSLWRWRMLAAPKFRRPKSLKR